MPSLRNSAIVLDKERYRPAPAAAAAPLIQHPPIEAPNLRRSQVMISSLPSISTDVDGITRQFYGGTRNFPTRRIAVV
jgi:hypothetical protein